jgi:hypothetical protein
MVVVLKFSQGEEFIPVILSLVYEESQELFDFLVRAFRLSICLRMVGSGGANFDSQKSV